MRKVKKIMGILILWSGLVWAEQIIWTDSTDAFDFPEGITLSFGQRKNPALTLWVLDVDLNQENLAVRPYITTSPAPVRTLAQTFNVYAAINGGFFGGSTSYSAVIYPEEVKARNIGAVTRNGKSYPVMRCLFSMNEAKEFSVDWIYHFGSKPEQTYRYDTPMSYAYNDPNPKPAPLAANGTPMEDLLIGIGGGPTLVKNGEIHITYNEEIMWGSGVGLSNADPRTAIGYTEDNHVIMVAADGRQATSQGVSLEELAEILISFNCHEAINLDGGGSTQMAVPGKNINSPSENRSVPTIFAVVHADSLGLVEIDERGVIIDTDDEACELLGSDWFPTANPGYWGMSPSMLNVKGEGFDQAVFTPLLPKASDYHVYAWWVPASNRCLDTPIVIYHHAGIDTIRVNQTTGGDQWNYLGTYSFVGDIAEKVIISDAATSGFYIVADAIRFLDIDSTVTHVVRHADKMLPETYELGQNYPNPFNPTTIIKLALPEAGNVNLVVYNILGQHVAEIYQGHLNAGYHHFNFTISNLSSGVYFYRITVNDFTAMKKMIILK